MTRVAWAMKKSQIQKQFPEMTRERFTFVISRSEYEMEWGRQYRTPGLFDKTAAMLFRILPKIGPFEALAFKQPTSETESLFMDSLEESVEIYKELLWQVAGGRLKLENINLDTGNPTRPGDYKLADQGYVRLLNELAKNDFRHMTVALRENIASFYGQEVLATRIGSAHRNRTQRELERLRKAQAHTGGTR
jgi:hypothetical protein